MMQNFTGFNMHNVDFLSKILTKVGNLKSKANLTYHAQCYHHQVPQFIHNSLYAFLSFINKLLRQSRSV